METETPSIIRERSKITENTAKSQCSRIFENVYDQLRRSFVATTLEKHGESFIMEIVAGVKRHIDEIENRGLTNQQIYQEIWQKMAEYISTYKDCSGFEKKKKDVSETYTRLIASTNKLVGSGEVDPKTAKVFLRALCLLKGIGDYNTIIRNSEDIKPEILTKKNTDYAKIVEGMWAKQPKKMRYEQDGAFYHFNSHLEGEVKNRIYISAQLSGAPGKVVEAWDAVLEETGLQNKVYFKLSTGLGRRFETIVIYQTDKIKDADLEKLFLTFIKKCPTELLNKKNMPTGVPLYRGISMASEPANINTFRRFSGLKADISYNEFIAALSELSFELAHNDV